MSIEELKKDIMRELTGWDYRFDGPETVADAILERCWEEINQYIKQGDLGEPANSERNGLILAANLLRT